MNASCKMFNFQNLDILMFDPESQLYFIFYSIFHSSLCEQKGTDRG